MKIAALEILGKGTAIAASGHIMKGCKDTSEQQLQS